MKTIKLNLEIILRSRIDHQDEESLIKSIDQVLRDLMCVGCDDDEILDFFDQYPIDEMSIISHQIIA